MEESEDALDVNLPSTVQFCVLGILLSNSSSFQKRIFQTEPRMTVKQHAIVHIETLYRSNENH
jgi:hypothetical protein